jgi:hypothetical protein
MARTRIAYGVVALALVATACSGGGSDGDTSEATLTPTVETGATPSPSSGEETTAPTDAETTGSTEDAPPATETAAATGDPEPVEVAVAVPAALQFTAPAVGGGEIDAAEYAGTPTLFWFWAPT